VGRLASLAIDWHDCFCGRAKLGVLVLYVGVNLGFLKASEAELTDVLETMCKLADL
jgi:hypothetical protein